MEHPEQQGCKVLLVLELPEPTELLGQLETQEHLELLEIREQPGL